MTQKDYILIAGVIRNASLSTSERAALTLDMEKVLRADNPRFNSQLWHNACRAEETDDSNGGHAYNGIPS